MRNSCWLFAMLASCSLAAACSVGPVDGSPEHISVVVKTVDAEPVTLDLRGPVGLSQAAVAAVAAYFDATQPADGQPLPDMSPGDTVKATVSAQAADTILERWVVVTESAGFDGAGLQARIASALGLSVPSSDTAARWCAACTVGVGDALGCSAVPCGD